MSQIAATARIRNLSRYHFVLVALLGSLTGARPLAQIGSGHELSGMWRLRIETARDAGSQNQESSRIRGEVALLRTPSYSNYEWVTAVDATHFGVFTLDKEVFQLPPMMRAALTDEFWAAAGKFHGADSVEIILRPGLIHGSVVLSGRFDGDSIRGVVAVQGYALAEAGTFVLSRR